MPHTYHLIEAKIPMKVRKKQNQKTKKKINNEMLSFKNFFCVSLFLRVLV